jgi:hypothetical protein
MKLFTLGKELTNSGHTKFNLIGERSFVSYIMSLSLKNLDEIPIK